MDKSASRTGVYGASGSGKSTLVKRTLLKGKTRVVVFDPLGEYATMRGFVRVDPSDDNERHLKAALAKRWAKGFKLAYVPETMQEARRLHRVSRVLQAAQRAYFDGRDKRQLTLVVEEMNLSFPVTSLPADLNGFADLCSRGRHYGVEVVGVTQRLAEVNTRFRGNTEAAYVFPIGNNPRDLQAALALLGPRWRERVANLKTHEWLRVSQGSVSQGRNKL